MPSYLELVISANAGLPDAARLTDGAVVVIAGDVRLVYLPRHIGTCMSFECAQDQCVCGGARLPNAARSADGAVVVIAGDVRLV